MERREPETTSDSERANLHLERPYRQVPFVGRTSELEDVDERLESNDGVVTIVGPPGVGKTRLAEELGRRLHERFADAGGTWMVSCRDLYAPAEIARRVSERCGFALPQLDDVDATIEAVGEHLNRDDRLLILDDLDRASEAGRRLLRAWADGSGDCRFLATSRRPLDIEPESLVELEPLSQDDGVELFRKAVEATRYDSADYDRELLERLVDQLERVPLSLKLAAARTPVMEPETILERLDEQLDVLSRPDGDRGPQWHSLRLAIDRSWRQLAPAERATLAQLSVFEGGFDRDALEAVLDLEGLTDEPDRLQIIQNLVEHSLLYRERTQPDAGEEFALYTAVRSFASEKLEEIGGTEAAARRHADHYTSVAGEFLEGMFRPGMEAALRNFGRQLPNLAQATEWALDHEPMTAAKLAVALSEYDDWRPIQFVRGELFERVADRLSPSSDEERVYANRIRRLLLATRFNHGDIDGEAFREQSDAIARKARDLGDDHTLFRAVRRIAWEWRHRDRYDRALERVERALEATRDREPSSGRARLLTERISLLGRAGELDEAREAYRRARRAFDDVYDPLGEWELEHHRWHLELARDNPTKAAEAAERARRLAEGRDEPRQMGYTYFAQGLNSLSRGELDRARDLAERAYEMVRPFGKTRSVLQIQLNRGAVHLARGEFDEAEQHLAEAREGSRQYGSPTGRVAATAWEAVLAFRRGRIARGEELLEEARNQSDAAAPMLQFVEGERRLARAAERMEQGREVASHRALMAARLVARDGAPERKVPTSSAQPTIEATLARRFLKRAADAFWRDHRESFTSIDRGLRVGGRTGWFQVDDGDSVDLSGRGPLRRVLSALVEQRLNAPDGALDTSDLLEAGWPDEELSADDHASRVYTAISELRSLGLDALLERDSRGYFLDPTQPVVVADEPRD